jgi:lipoprotein-anchoring transpeptidase ErfK/SrfK
VLKRIVVLFALLAVATVPLARAGGSDDPGVTTATDPYATIGGDTTAPATTTTAPTTTTTPPPAPPVAGTIAPGVTISGVDVGGMTEEQAMAAVEDAFAQPVRFTFKKRAWWADPTRLGGKAYVRGAVQRALLAPAGSAVDLVVTVKGAAVDDYLAYLKRNFARPAKNSTLRLVKLRPKISKSRDGFAVDARAMKAAIVRAVKSLQREPVPLQGKVLKPQKTQEDFGPIIVIRRGSNKLYLYDGQKFVRRFSVATGQPSYPTPLGHFEIVVKQRDPWWYPPQDSDWAKGEKPVPPGPTNPLGTRWMGLSAPLVGIHGTPNSYSIGYSASHGCIRMLVPEAEWLFERVEIGTPVFIVPQ